MPRRLITIPGRFFADHAERELPTPAVVALLTTGGGIPRVLIDADDPALPELTSDARFYASPDGPDCAPSGVVTSARALLASLAKQGALPAPRRIEAHGVKGAQSRPWTRTFASRKALQRWVSKQEGDVEVHATREVPE